MATSRATATSKSTPTRDLSAEVAFLTRALKAPTLRECIARLAERARAESWSHEEYLVACLQREVTAVALDTGELACRHRRSFAGGLTFTDPTHQSQLERLRGERRDRQVEVEMRPLARYDALIPA